MPQQPVWEPTDADLVAYLLNDLGGARAEYVQAHLAQCPECRERLLLLEQTLERLETLPEPTGDDRQQHVLKARLQMEAAGTPPDSGGWLQRAQVGVAVVTLFLCAIVLSPILTGAGNPRIHDLVSVDPDLPTTSQRPVIDDYSSSAPTVEASALPGHVIIPRAALPFAPIAPDLLPGSNQRVETNAFADGSFAVGYRGDDGLRLILRQEPAVTDAIRFNQDVPYETLQIGDIEAVTTFDAALNNVNQMYWVRGGIFFSLQALRSGLDDFPVAEAVQVVERLIALQDNPE